MTKKILIVDDDSVFVDMLKETLENFEDEEISFYIDGVNSSKQAIELSRSNKYDFLILEYLIDRTNGKQVVEKVREFDKDVRIILLTGHSDYVNEIGALKDMDIQLFIEKEPLALGRIKGEIVDLLKFEVPEKKRNS